MMKHINITISGIVQGVGFRHAATHQARFLGAKGFVRNLPNGTMYIKAENENATLAELVKWCRKGPTFSEEEAVNVEEGELKGFALFDTRY